MPLHQTTKTAGQTVQTGVDQHSITNDQVGDLYKGAPYIQSTITIRTPIDPESDLYKSVMGNAPLALEERVELLERINRQIEADIGDTFESDIENLFSRIKRP